MTWSVREVVGAVYDRVFLSDEILERRDFSGTALAEGFLRLCHLILRVAEKKKRAVIDRAYNLPHRRSHVLYVG